MMPTIYDFISLWLAICGAIYYDRRHRQSTNIRRVLTFTGIVVGLTLWAVITFRALP